MPTQAMQQQGDGQPAASTLWRTGQPGLRARSSLRRDLMTIHVPAPTLDDAPWQLSSAAVSDAEIMASDSSLSPLNTPARTSQPRARHVSNIALSFTAHPTPSP